MVSKTSSSVTPPEEEHADLVDAVRTALSMGRTYNEQGWTAEFCSPEELEFLGSYLRAFVLWQELGSKDDGP